jgi:hypothetical protein
VIDGVRDLQVAKHSKRAELGDRLHHIATPDMVRAPVEPHAQGAGYRTPLAVKVLEFDHETEATPPPGGGLYDCPPAGAACWRAQGVSRQDTMVLELVDCPGASTESDDEKQDTYPREAHVTREGESNGCRQRR